MTQVHQMALLGKNTREEKTLKNVYVLLSFAKITQFFLKIVINLAINGIHSIIQCNGKNLQWKVIQTVIFPCALLKKDRINFFYLHKLKMNVPIDFVIFESSKLKNWKDIFINWPWIWIYCRNTLMFFLTEMALYSQ